MKYITIILLMLFCSISLANANTKHPVRNIFENTDHVNITPHSTYLQSMFITIHYAKATNIMHFISNKSNNILSAEGKINYDRRTNQIWVRDYKSNLNYVKEIIQHLDIPAKQVSITAKIINIDDNYVKTLGVLFNSHPSTVKSNGLHMNFT